MSFPIGFQPPSIFPDAHKNSQATEQKPTFTPGGNPVRTVSTHSSMPPASRGEMNTSHLPARGETRPVDDRRSAKQISDNNPILNVGILEEKWGRGALGHARWEALIDGLKQQVGDFTPANTDPESRNEAMFRLARVVNYIDHDPGVERIRNHSVGDGFLDAIGSYDSSSEVGRLEAFSQQGYPALEEVFNGRVRGDYRTVEEITAGPLFKGLHAALSDEELNAFKAKIGGDWESPEFPPDRRAELAANAERVLQIIDRKGGKESTAGNGKIDGLREYASLAPDLLQPEFLHTLPGSEARRLVQFANHGFSALHQQ